MRAPTELCSFLNALKNYNKKCCLPVMRATNSVKNTPCGGCGEPVGNVRTCPVCAVSMHPFCGTAVGNGGYGQPIMCPGCQRREVVEIASPSPIVAAFSSMCCTHRGPLSGGNGDDAPNTVSVDESDNPPTLNTNGDGTTPPRAAQVVSTVKHRVRVVQWLLKIEKKGGLKGLFAQAVDAFPEIFRARQCNASIGKAMSWWKQRERILGHARGQRELSARRAGGRTRANRKVLSRRGRRKSEWVSWMYPRLLDEFDRLRKLGLQFDTMLLRQVALRLLKTSTATFNGYSVDNDGALLVDKITPRWIQTFMEANQIVLRTQSGKKSVSAEKQASIEREVAEPLGKLKRGFESEKYNEDAVENIDETHFVMDFNNNKTLGFKGKENIKYADVVSGGERMTMVDRIPGGASGHIHPPMMIFQNTGSNYPIKGVSDNTPGVSYRTGPKGWMSQRVFREYLAERRAMNGDRH